jgi:hypothetical protein
MEPHSSVIIAVEREGKLEFRWACEHHPVGDAAILLASSTCAAQFCEKHPEYLPEIERLLAAKNC